MGIISTIEGIHEGYPSARDKLLLGWEAGKAAGKLAFIKILRVDDEFRQAAIAGSATRNLVDKGVGTPEQQQLLANRLPGAQVQVALVERLYES